MEWSEIDITSEKIGKDKYVAIGNGRIKISKGACDLIKDFDKCDYVTFLRAKKDRILFVGLRFEQNETNNSLKIDKDEDEAYGAIIYARDIVETFYGEEGKSKSYTKHLVDFDPKNPNILVIYYNYRKQYIILNGLNKPMRQKHIGVVIDKEWKVLSSYNHTKENGKKAPMYKLKNINTGEEISISSRALIDIERGLTTIENIKLARTIGIASYLGKRRSAKKKRIKPLNSI